MRYLLISLLLALSLNASFSKEVIALEKELKNSYLNKTDVNPFINKILAKNKVQDIMYLAIFVNQFEDYENLLKLYDKVISLDPNYVKVYTELYYLYQNGNSFSGFAKDETKALKYLKKAAELKDSGARIVLLNYYRTNALKKEFDDLSTELSKTIDGKFLIAKMYYNNFETKKAFEIFDELANKGHRESMFILAKKNQYGKVDEQIKKLSFKWNENILKSNDYELQIAVLVNLLKTGMTAKFFDSFIPKYVKKVDKSDKNLVNNLLKSRNLKDEYKQLLKQ